MQKFKNDDFENKIINGAKSVFDDRSWQKTVFFDECFSTYNLGDILRELNAMPLSRAIKEEIFREIFSELLVIFKEGGTFENYISVFKKVFGDDVSVTFTIPAPAKLEIDIVATGLLISDLVSRYIEENEYRFDEIIDQEGDNIAAQTVKGFETQYELEQMLFELVAGGIFTTITLTLGGD